MMNINIPLMRRVLRTMKRDPRIIDQNIWFNGATMKGCVAGWAMYLSRDKMTPDEKVLFDLFSSPLEQIVLSPHNSERESFFRAQTEKLLGIPRNKVIEYLSPYSWGVERLRQYEVDKLGAVTAQMNLYMFAEN